MEIEKKAGVAILISNKMDFKTIILIKGKGKYIMIKGSIQQDNIKFINKYTSNCKDI